jgi:magnesium transporter
MSEDQLHLQSRHDDENRLEPAFVAEVLEQVEAGNAEKARELVAPLHPADIADLYELTPADQRAALSEAIDDLIDGDVLAEMNDHVREELIDTYAPQEVAELAAEMDTDDAVAIIEDMDEDDQRAVLRAMSPDDRAAIEEGLSFPAESAGRLMQRELIAVPEHMTVGDVIDYLRENQDLATDFWEVFVVDPRHRPIGTCQLSWVLRTPRSVPMADVMKREQTLIPVDMDQEEVALLFQKYALISAAVVDQSGRLIGMITVDDVVHVIQEEAGEDVLRLAGAGDGDINEPIFETIKSRMWWLLINLGTAIFAAIVPAYYGDTIAHLAILAALMGIVTGMGGNAGTQTMAVTVRALATNQITSSNTQRMIVREFLISVANGIVLGLVMAIGCQLLYHNTTLSLVFMTGWVINSMAAGIAGILIPLGLEKMKVDPAVVSTVFVTWVTDTMGFFAFLGLAKMAGL